MIFNFVNICYKKYEYLNNLGAPSTWGFPQYWGNYILGAPRLLNVFV